MGIKKNTSCYTQNLKLFSITVYTFVAIFPLIVLIVYTFIEKLTYIK